MFISFEGIDFSGKSTQCTRLLARLSRQGREVLFIREPGGTDVSEAIRSVLLDTRYRGLTPVSELLLFSAARAQLVREAILPALARGAVVVADRYHDSTTAYQGYGRGLDLDAIAHVHALATGGVLPDLTLLVDVPVDVSLARRAQMARAADRMEESDRGFHERVRAGYLQIAAAEPGRITVIDGTSDPDRVGQAIDAVLDVRLAAGGAA